MEHIYTGYAVSVKGTIFRHPLDGSDEARRTHQWAKANGEYPYTHIYEGDNMEGILYALQNPAK